MKLLCERKSLVGAGIASEPRHGKGSLFGPAAPAPTENPNPDQEVSVPDTEDAYIRLTTLGVAQVARDVVTKLIQSLNLLNVDTEALVAAYREIDGLCSEGSVLLNEDDE
jgi:hypothetical protein